jgi:hypothetical protein
MRRSIYLLFQRKIRLILVASVDSFRREILSFRYNKQAFSFYIQTSDYILFGMLFVTGKSSFVYIRPTDSGQAPRRYIKTVIPSFSSAAEVLIYLTIRR